jgi:hypothetical protein
MAARSFSCEFNAHWAVQLLVSTAHCAGTPVCPDQLTPGLASEFPEFSASELTGMLCAAAFEASVPIQSGETGSSAAGAGHH